MAVHRTQAGQRMCIVFGHLDVLAIDVQASYSYPAVLETERFLVVSVVMCMSCLLDVSHGVVCE